jgi:hypothetical protein
MWDGGSLETGDIFACFEACLGGCEDGDSRWTAFCMRSEEGLAGIPHGVLIDGKHTQEGRAAKTASDGELAQVLQLLWTACLSVLRHRRHRCANISNCKSSLCTAAI